jgi:biofilm PGA synthesis N-glycosyltransferase PgaC
MKLDYILLTPARNEEEYIENTIKSVIAQTRLPQKWIIISDGSTDRTDDIVKEYSKKNQWIELLRMPEREKRDFSSKVIALRTAYEKLKHLNFDIIATLDADITFHQDYFSFLLGKFVENETLGIAGTPFIEGDFNSYYDSSSNINHVSGACQVFRRKCYEDIGGHPLISGGGEDWAAVTTARMKGWQTRTFPEENSIHHRKMGTEGTNILKARFNQGKEDYYLGGHPGWEFIRSFFQIMKKPYIIGGFLIMTGYIYSFITRVERPISDELIRFHRNEQLTRLRKMLFGKFIKSE